MTSPGRIAAADSVGPLSDVVLRPVRGHHGKELAPELGFTYVHVDVTSKEEVDALFKTAKDTYGSVDIAFNNAGISPPDDDSILDTDLEAWKRVQDVNLTSVYLCCKAALPYMRQRSATSTSVPSATGPNSGTRSATLVAARLPSSQKVIAGSWL